MAELALGRLFDVCHGVIPTADTAVALTGARVHMKNYGGIAIVAYFGAVSAGTDTFVPDIQQADAKTGGSLIDLDVVTQWHIKFETTLDGDETWTTVTQAAGSEISLTGATYAATQVLMVAEVTADQLSDGYEWVSVVQADPGSGGTRTGAMLYIPFDLKYQRAPANLPEPNA